MVDEVRHAPRRRHGEDVMPCELCGRPMLRAHGLLIDREEGLDEPGEEEWVWVCADCWQELNVGGRVPVPGEEPLEPELIAAEARGPA